MLQKIQETLVAINARACQPKNDSTWNQTNILLLRQIALNLIYVYRFFLCTTKSYKTWLYVHKKKSYMKEEWDKDLKKLNSMCVNVIKIETSVNDTLDQEYWTQTWTQTCPNPKRVLVESDQCTNCFIRS